MASFILLLIQALAAFLFGTLLFDIVHYLLHQALKSSFVFLRIIGRWHSAHHCFFPASLQLNSNWQKKNLKQHVFFEHSVQAIGTLFTLLFLPISAVLLALSMQGILLMLVIRLQGADPHHQPYKYLPPDRSGLFVSAEYHALHHVYPNYFFSGYIKLLDYFLGTCLPLAGKHIVMTGASGALGKQMKILLEKEGAIVTPFKFGVDYDYDHYEKLIPALAKADILFLCHGSKHDNAQQANCDSFVALIELFKQQHGRGLIPKEVWAVGSEIECHPCFGIKKLYPYANSKRHFAKHARAYFHSDDIQYRHIVHSAFNSPMGPGLMSARFAAKVTLFLLKRGFKYVPVTYTGFAFMNYFRYAFKQRAIGLRT